MKKVLLFFLFLALSFPSQRNASAQMMETYESPAFDLLEIKSTEHNYQLKFKESPQKMVGIFYSIPNDKTPAVKMDIQDGILCFDTSNQEKDGYKNVQMNLVGFDPKKMSDMEYCMYAVVEGPRGGTGNFYYEGRRNDGSHYYKALPVRFNGQKQTFAFNQVIPTDLQEIHLRFDFFKAGKYKFHKVSLAKETFDPSSVAPITPELMFHASFDGTTEPVVALGDKKPVKEKNVAFEKGIAGQAVCFDKANNAVLAYSLAKNLNPERGAVSVWIKPRWSSDPEKMAEYQKMWRTIFSMPWEDSTRAGSGALWFWIYEGRLRADTSDLLDSYSISSLPGTDSWIHLVFNWDPLVRRVYINGKASGGGSDSLNRAQPIQPLRYTRMDFKEFFIGNYQGRPFEGLIDDLQIFSAPLSNEEVQKIRRQYQTISLEPDNRYFFDDKPIVLKGKIENTGKTASSLSMEIIDATGQPVNGLTKQLNIAPETVSDYTLDIPTPTAGIYRVKLFADKEELVSYVINVFQSKLVAKKPDSKARRRGAWDKQLQLKLIETIDPMKIDPNRIALVGKLEEKELGGRKYLQTEGKPGQRFAIHLSPLTADKLYCFEWDFPDDMKRTVDIVAQSSVSSSGGEYELQIGYLTGDEYPATGEMKTQRCLYWAPNSDISIIFMSAREGEGGAALAQLRVYEVEGELPKAAVNPAKPVDGWTRPVGIYFEDPAINYDFAADGGQLQYFEKFIHRLGDYMDYSGQNLLAYPLVWYNGMIGPKYQPRPHIPNYFEAFLSVFDRRGLEFMGTINQNNVPFDLPYVTRAGIKSGVYNNSAFTIHNTGTPHPGGWHGSPPNFNTLHPDVQKMTLQYFDEILAVGVSHPSFKGIIMHLPRHALHSFGDIRAGYNDYLVDDFEKDTGIKIPVDKKAPNRGKLYYEWLMKNAREQWIDWRCKELAAWYKVLAKKLRDARSDLKLGINCMTPIRYEPSHFDENNKADVWGAVNREAGIDAKYFADVPNIFIEQTLFPADYRWMEGRSKPEIRELIRNTETRPGMYESLQASDRPWIHMHDRYWESAIGNATKSGKNGQFDVPWIKEHSWRVSTLNPIEFYSMKHYVMPLRYQDVLGFSKGGFLIGTYGMENWLVPFAEAFRALPAVPFKEVSGSTETVKIRSYRNGKTLWFYVVNTEEKSVQIEFTVKADSVIDLGRDIKAPVRNDVVRTTVKPFELRSFSAETESPLGVKVTLQGKAMSVKN